MAIFTKFDQFVEGELQTVMENAADGDEEEDDDIFEEEAKKCADEKFQKYYKARLLEMPHPPKAIVAISHGKQFSSCWSFVLSDPYTITVKYINLRQKIVA